VRDKKLKNLGDRRQTENLGEKSLRVAMGCSAIFNLFMIDFSFLTEQEIVYRFCSNLCFLKKYEYLCHGLSRFVSVSEALSFSDCHCLCWQIPVHFCLSF